MSVVKDVDLEAMPTSIFLNDDDDDDFCRIVDLVCLKIKQRARIVRRCKDVTMPTNIFIVSNLVSAALLVRMCINTDPLIAGTNRKAYLLHTSFALKDSYCH